jgi:hypothetical protein
MSAPHKLVAARLPLSLVSQAQRYADLYRTTVSQLIRQGLELRLRAPALPLPGPATSSETACE